MRKELLGLPGASFQMEEVEVEDHQGQEEEVAGDPQHRVEVVEVEARPALVEVVEGEEPPQDQGEQEGEEEEGRAFQ